MDSTFILEAPRARVTSPWGQLYIVLYGQYNTFRKGLHREQLAPKVEVEDSVLWTPQMSISLFNWLGMLEGLSIQLCLGIGLSGFRSMHAPRWSIIQWMAIHGRLPTRDRLLQLGVVSDSTCVLCNSITEKAWPLTFCFYLPIYKSGFE